MRIMDENQATTKFKMNGRAFRRRRGVGVLLRKAAPMASRTTQTVAFRLPGFEAWQPAGDYRVDHDEESIEGISRLAWRRVGAFIHLPAIAMQSSAQQMVPLNPADLDAALEKDLG